MLATFKKLFFALPFLLAFLGFNQNLQTLLTDSSLIFSFNKEILVQTLLVLVFLLAGSFFLVVFISLAEDLILVLPALILVSLIPLLASQNSLNLILSGGFFLSFLLVYFLLYRKLHSYLTFHSVEILGPFIRQTVTLLLLVSSLVFYINTNKEIKQNGFTIPDALLEMSMKFSPLSQETQTTSETPPPAGEPLSQLQISPEQLQLLKSQPELLKQYGLDPTILDSLGQQNQSGAKAKKELSMNDVIKNTIQSQFQSIIKPYLFLIPIILTLAFYLSLSSVASLLGIATTPLIWLTFYLLEKTGYINFQVEMREVKKLVV